MKCLTYRSKQDVAYSLAGNLVSAVVENPRISIGLPGELFTMPAFTLFRDRLVEMMAPRKESFQAVNFFATHEYCPLGFDSPESNAYALWHRFLKVIGASPSRVFLMDGSALDPEEECNHYEARIRSCGGIDLLILTLGRHGEIACNETGSSLGSRCRFKLIYHGPSPGRSFTGGWRPEAALTMGVGTIMEARRLILLVMGEEMVAIATRVLDGPLSASMTASVIQGHPRALVMLDQAAACFVRACRPAGITEHDREGLWKSPDEMVTARRDPAGAAESQRTGPVPDFAALRAAILGGEHEKLAGLLAAGGNANSHDDGGVTLLHVAAGRGDTRSLGMLIEAGAEINLRDKGGATALQWAIYGRQAQAIAFLRRHDAVK